MAILLPEVKPKQSKNIFRNFSFDDISFFSDKKKKEFYKQLSLLLKANVDINQALLILINQEKKKNIKRILLSIRDEIIKGKTLSESFNKTGKFSTYEYLSIKIGEETNNLDVIFKELEKYYERKIKLKRQITSILTYPIFVILTTFVVLGFMLNNVVPMFESIFKQFGGDLPDITKKIIFLSEHFNYFVTIILTTLIVLISAHFFLRKREAYRSITSNILLHLPYIGNVFKTFYFARFNYSMSLLLSSKISLISSLKMVKKMISYYPIETTLDSIEKDIIKGEMFSKAMKKHKIYPNKIITLVKVGEETNQLEKAFKTLSDNYDADLEYQTKIMGVVLEPLMIIILGIIVGFIMVAMYSPMFNLSKILGK